MFGNRGDPIKEHGPGRRGRILIRTDYGVVEGRIPQEIVSVKKL